MKILRKLFVAVVALLPLLALGAAGDIKISQQNSSGTAWIDRILTNTAGSLIYVNASGVPTVLAPGTSGYVLTSGGTGVAPSYVAVTGTGTTATNAQTLAGTSTSLLVTPAGWNYASSAVRNTLAPRGGVFFNGINSSRVYSTLTGNNIGSDPFSLFFIFKVPLLSGTTHGLFLLASSSTDRGAASSFSGTIESGGALRIQTVNSGANGGVFTDISGFQSTYAGKTVALAITRSGSTLAVYINGVAQTVSVTTYGSSPGDFSMAITSTYFGIGYITASTVSTNMAWNLASLYNLALSSSEVSEIYELGGNVPSRYQFGSQTARYASDFSAGTDSWNTQASQTYTGNVDSGADGPGVPPSNDWLRGTRDSTTGNIATYRSATLTLGKVYRITADVFIPTGSPITSIAIGQNTGLGTTVPYVALTAGSTTAYSYTMTGGVVVSNTDLGFTLSANVAATTSIYFKNINAVQIGAVVHLPLDDGIGYQLHDASTNQLDAVMTTSGITHIIAKRDGYVRGTLTWAGTHEAKSVLGQRSFPNQYVLTLLTTKATAGSSGSGLTGGVTSNAALFVAATTYTTSKKGTGGGGLTMASNGVSVGVTDNDCTLVVDPDTANYTGSITVEARYSVTEGTP